MPSATYTYSVDGQTFYDQCTLLVETIITDENGEFSFNMQEWWEPKNVFQATVTPISASSSMSDALSSFIYQADTFFVKGRVFHVVTGQPVGQGVSALVSVLIN